MSSGLLSRLVTRPRLCYAKNRTSWFSELKCLEGKQVDLDKLSQALASVRGITLGITLVDQRYGGLKIDFTEDVSMTADFAKPFVTWGQVGLWFERYAKKIDNLPILNVDNELLDYGVFVADSLRQSETAMKGIGAKSGYRKTQLSNVTGTTYYGGYEHEYGGPVTRAGAVGANVNAADANLAYRGQAEAQIRTQERITGNANAHFIMQGVEQATSAVRRAMTQKYKMAF